MNASGPRALNVVAPQLGELLQRKIASGTLPLPVLPTAAAQTLRLLDSQNTTIRALASSIESDPLLAVQVIKAANGAAYGGTQVSTIEAALTRMGLVRARGVLMAACMRKVFSSRDPRIQAALIGVLEHSLAVGLLARDLASVLGGAETETAFLAGIMHDIGKAVVAVYLLELEKEAAVNHVRFLDSNAWMSVVRTLHQPVGLTLLERWGMPDDVVAAVRSSTDFDPVKRHSAANFVRFANAVTKLGGIYVGPFAEDETSALVMVGRSLLGVDDGLVERLTSDLHERARKMVR